MPDYSSYSSYSSYPNIKSIKNNDEPMKNNDEPNKQKENRKNDIVLKKCYRKLYETIIIIYSH